MHLKIFASLATLPLLASILPAAEANALSLPETVVTSPSTPAPAVAGPAQAVVPNQIVYTPRLPTAAELTTAAAAQGLFVERLEQTPSQILATYKRANGQTNIVSYQTLPPAGANSSAPVTTAPVSRPPAVVYEQPAPSVVYYYDDPFYYPRYWYPPVSVRLGFGGYFGGGGYSHFRGGFRRGR